MHWYALVTFLTAAANMLYRYMYKFAIGNFYGKSELYQQRQ